MLGQEKEGEKKGRRKEGRKKLLKKYKIFCIEWFTKIHLSRNMATSSPCVSQLKSKGLNVWYDDPTPITPSSHNCFYKVLSYAFFLYFSIHIRTSKLNTGNETLNIYRYCYRPDTVHTLSPWIFASILGNRYHCTNFVNKEISTEEISELLNAHDQKAVGLGFEPKFMLFQHVTLHCLLNCK